MKLTLTALLTLCFAVNIAIAQTIKTDVLVIGGGAAGVAAGIQAARSNVKTMLLEQGPWLGGSFTAGGMCIVEGNSNLPSGIWGEFRTRLRQYYKASPGYDTSLNATLRFEPFVGALILRKLTDTVKNLTVKLNTTYTGIKRNGDEWEVTYTDKGEAITIKARVLVDGTETGDVAAKLGARFDYGFDNKQATGEAIAPDAALPLIQEVTWCAVLKDYGRAADRTIDKPAGYNAAAYACLKGKDIGKMLADGKLPNSKYLIKWASCANSYPVTPAELTPARRDSFYRACRLKTLGLVYYLQTELGFKNLSLDFQEFPTADHLPYVPYMREAGRAQGLLRMTTNDIFKPYDQPTKLYRTAIAVGDAMPGQHYPEGSNAPKVSYPPFPGYSVPLGAVVSANVDNLLLTEKAISVSHLANASTMYPSVQMAIGQGVGTVAAYCAFFKTTTQNLDVRKIQTELLDFKGWLMPFADVPATDHDFRAIQQIGATGLIKGVQVAKAGNAAAVCFMPDTLVSTAEVKPVLLEIYTRSFLWFNREQPGTMFTLGNLISFISDLTLSEPKTLQLNIQKAWTTGFKFNTPYDLARPITRREFAVLANKYINPFGRRVDLKGRLLN